MSDNTISIDPDKAARAVQLIANGQEAAGSLNVRGTGSSVGPASEFKQMLTSWVMDTRKALTEIELHLGELQTNVTQTVVELGERDSTLAAETATFQEGVSDIPAPPAAPDTSTPPTTPGASGTPTSGPVIK